MDAVKCPGCGSSLIYDIDDDILKCNYCGSFCTIKGEQVTDTEFLKNRLTDVQEVICPNCNAKLITTTDTISTKCIYCKSSIIYDEKVDKAFYPQKILCYELELNEAKNKLIKYLKDKKIKNKYEILKNLKQVYLPFWLYNSKIYLKNEKKDFYKIECKNILADASTKIFNGISDKFDNDFDFSKLKNFNLDFIAGYKAEEFDVSSREVYRRVLQKIENIVKSKYHEYTEIENTMDEKMYILLPFYYVEFSDENRILDGYQLLINGQNGKIYMGKNQKYSSSKLELPTKHKIYRFFSIFFVIYYLSIFLLFPFFVIMGIVDTLAGTNIATAIMDILSMLTPLLGVSIGILLISVILFPKLPSIMLDYFKMDEKKIKYLIWKDKRK